ncbi:MAG: LptF/LptG family permease [Candidatus Poribacteria bacterium]
MKVIDRYLFREFIKSFLACLGFFTALLLVVRFGEKEVGTFIAKRMSLIASIESLFLQVPGYVIQIAPPSMLFATFFSLGRMTQNNEITAMRTCGISLYRIFLPIFLSAFCIAIIMIVFNDQVVTRAVKRDIELKGLNIEAPGVSRNIVFISSDNHIFYIDAINLNSQSMERITIYELDEKDNVKSQIDAKSASWTDGTWHLKDGVIRTYKDGLWQENPFNMKDVSVQEAPEIMVKSSQDKQTLQLTELSKLINYKKRTGQVVRKDLVSFHSRLSFPYACFVMAMLGAPLFVMFGKSGAAVGFLLTMFISFVYWGVAIAIFEALGNSGVLPPIVSCWSANIIFMFVGAVFVYKVKK